MATSMCDMSDAPGERASDVPNDNSADDDEVEIIDYRQGNSKPPTSEPPSTKEPITYSVPLTAKQLTTVVEPIAVSRSTTTSEFITIKEPLTNYSSNQEKSFKDENKLITPWTHLISQRQKQTNFLFGPYVPIIKTEDKIIVDPQGVIEDYKRFTQSAITQRLLGEILPDDSIVEAPSLVTPLLLKKKTIWPPKELAESTEVDNLSDDIQIVKLFGREVKPDIIHETNPRYRKPESYIKDTVVSNLTNSSKNRIRHRANQTPILATDDFFATEPGKLLFSLGVSLVMEYCLDEKARKLNKKVSRGDGSLEPELEIVKNNLKHAKLNNRHLKLGKSLQCHLCCFKSDFSSVLNMHLDSPHRNSTRYHLCNWCTFKNKDSTQILYHNHVVHQKFRCLIEVPLAVHCCRYCQFESNSKRKYTPHITKCEKNFSIDLNLAPEDPDDYPTITPKLVTQHDIRIYESTLKALRLAAYNPHQIKVTSARNSDGMPILLIPKSSPATNLLLESPQLRQSVAQTTNPYDNLSAVIGQGSAGNSKTSDSARNQKLVPNLLRLLSTSSTVNNLPNNRPSLLQHPRPQSVFVNGMSVAKNVQNIVMAPPGQVAATKKNQSTIDERLLINDEANQTSSNPNDDGTFVICEICDAYIGNISFYKSHMQWVHKVKIHSKSLESLRPPLRCQKCNWRYFTDQGLERHLLGSHGLVTSNMQELAVREKDSGRCTICGARCGKKLVAHMKDIHKINLKPAQLSYKCTVCSAVFSLYKHFENHVYRVHGESLRRLTGDKTA